ncbi:putative UBA TS-N domain-containing protein [Rosellinia necatrix]|uniref:Putative UBA TS-N domain-containing protein n=1 Tax=Rosellinia necatrix TaxID=77044 RepID=A0A1S7UKY6_ROSNE|nr:putative UBA TS-N domain-containing protein [Rosellinia necatrix]
MDDLSGLDWSAANPTNGNGNKPPPMNPISPPTFYPTLRPTPSPQPSGRSTPLSAQASTGPASKPPVSKPAADSFSNLVNFGGARNNANLSLRERQEQLAAEKRQKESEERQRLQSQYGGGQFWDTIGQGSGPASRTASPAVPLPAGAIAGAVAGANGQRKDDDDDDLFAAFEKNTKVDNSSHYPPPIQPSSGTSISTGAAKIDLSDAKAWTVTSTPAGNEFYDDDDDPFGLSQLKSKIQHQPQQQPSPNVVDDDDDFLGDLGKPVEEVRRKVQAAEPKRQPGKPIEVSDSESEPETSRRPDSDPFDQAVAELVDMGFTVENARRGLTESGAGLNVQAAVSWLLDDAHRQARNEKKARDPSDHTSREHSHSRDSRRVVRQRNDEDGPRPPRGDSQSPAQLDDISRKAAAMGSSLFKTANSLWKTGQKQVQKAVADFQQDGGDSNQPKWMRGAQQDRLPSRDKIAQAATDEALMLESSARPERQSSPHDSTRRNVLRDHHPTLPARPSGQSNAPRWQQSIPTASVDPRTRLKKQLGEEESAQAYVSPARRKKATPQPTLNSEPEVDLLFGSPAPSASSLQGAPQRSTQPSPVPRAASQSSSRHISPRPPPTRVIPTIPSSMLQASTRHRLDGTAHFKRGDYDAAHTAYTDALSGIPQNHPICIIILTNRALTSLKTGSPKQAVSDADGALSIIGPSHGEGESVALPDGESRDMKELYGKALSRKAEALEQMEKWMDAGNVWQQCVEAGVGGLTAVAGRQRCQKALAPKPKVAPRPAQVSKPRPPPSAISDLGPQKSSEAVQRLREANKAAEAADDEKFALSEKVDARIANWRDGKRDNLRALIGSLDLVLWENSGWKKVGLHELVIANKVKIHYMKAIAKCHPDKLPQDANTETRLIAATVFATLNESWDKFKADNGL